MASVTVTGADAHKDANGFRVQVDGGSPRILTSESTLIFADLSPGSHFVWIDDVAANCTVRSENPRTVTVVAGEAVAVVFDVDCQPPPTTGSIHVWIATPGFATFGASLGMGPVVNSVSGTVLFRDLAPGTYSVRLNLNAGACTIDQPNPRSATVTSGAITNLSFTLSCPPPTGSIMITVTTGGTDRPDSYLVHVWATSDFYCSYVCHQGVVLSNGVLRLDGLSIDEYYVRLSAVPRNCDVRNENSRAVTVGEGDTIIVSFDVDCQPPPTTGTIRVSVATRGFTSFGAALGTGAVVRALDGVVVFADVAPRTHSVRLSIDPRSCTIDQPNPRPATVIAGEVTNIAFSLSCPPSAGDLVVTVTTTGTNLPDSYTVHVAETGDYYCYYFTCRDSAVGSNGAVTFDGLSFVGHSVWLQRVPANCTASPDGHYDVQIAPDRVTRVAFALHCT